MPGSEYYCWVWKFDDRSAYVGYGRGKEPWSDVWAVQRQFDSPLNEKLRTLNTMPNPVAGLGCLVFPIYGNRARAMVRMLEKQLVGEGYTILSARDRTTINAGHKPKRKVLANGKMYSGVRAAARALGISASVVTLNCQAGKKGWSYLDG